jgi:peptide-methionine (S)-S-oxide reductase
METATFAGGCFWCTEAIFKRLKGVGSVLPGYSGGEVEKPTYDEVCAGDTGHAEAIQIEFDSKVISYKLLLEIFFYTHDPTTPNQQGNDIGPQYRSAVFYHSEEQKIETEKFIEELTSKKVYDRPIVTQIEPFKNFYEAEDYHKNYFDRNKEAPYCDITISPKIHKLLNKYESSVKEEYKKD